MNFHVRDVTRRLHCSKMECYFDCSFALENIVSRLASLGSRERWRHNKIGDGIRTVSPCHEGDEATSQEDDNNHSITFEIT